MMVVPVLFFFVFFCFFFLRSSFSASSDMVLYLIALLGMDSMEWCNQEEVVK
jgi:hypothetical protein